MMVSLDDIIDLPSFIDKSDDSVIQRYIEAHFDEKEDFEQKLNEVLESHQIDNATGDELDQIGAAFGPLGKRRGRDDQEYRIFIQSLVQSFRGRGTVPGIIAAVSAGLNTQESNVSVTEDFQNLEYIVELDEWNDHRGSTVEELSELADASVSRLKRISYNVADETAYSDDSFKATISNRVSEDALISDDGTASTVTNVGWDTDDWNTLNWSKEN